MSAELEEAIAELLELREEEIARIVATLGAPQRRAILESWGNWAHAQQRPQRPDWRVWLIQAGRGFGKTRAGAEWVSAQARANPQLRIALVGATAAEVEAVMVRGRSGLMAVAHAEETMLYYPTTGLVEFESGARAFAYSGANPDKLRGPEHHIAWCDELAKWARPDATWDNLLLTLRASDDPRVVVTTTPRPISLLKRLRGHGETMVTGGATGLNPHLPAAFVEALAARYAGTRFGRQEVGGELIDDIEGALWTRDGIEAARSFTAMARDERFVRLVIGVDPPVSAGGDACGIVAVALAADGVGHVIGDHSVEGLSPEGWARAVAAAAEAHGADRVVAEANQGGAMVESVLRAADCALPVRLVHARRGKAARAEPVAALFENGRARFAGAFPDLEDELCGLCAGGAYAGPGRSPDRADAMVWAFTELMLGRRRVPAVRGL